MSALAQGARGFVTRRLTGTRTRAAVKRAAIRYAWYRGERLRKSGQLPEIPNIYAAMSPKGGSQWAKALLDHPIVRSHTGLFTLPQMVSGVPEDGRGFPLATSVAGVYTSYEDFVGMPKPDNYRLFYIFRDPRELVVSSYFSAMKTHMKMTPDLEALRDELRGLSRDEGLLMAAELMTPRLQEMASWIGVDDPRIKMFRLDEIEADPQKTVQILEHCGLALSESEMETVLNETNRGALQQRDLAHRSDKSESHYRRDRSTYRDLFTPEHYAAINAAAPQLAQRLGYPADPVAPESAERTP